MDEKKLKLIETSLKLFSEKGFHSTSIQEIAEQSNISKGAFYLHFESKNELLEEIFRYYAEHILDKLIQATEPNKPAKEQLIEQITTFFEMFQDHYEFIVMLFHDNLQLGFKKNEFFDDLQRKSFEWTKQHLHHIYGQKIDKYTVDLAIELDGLIGSYLKWIFLHKLSFEPNMIAASIVVKLDRIANYVMTSQPKPNFTFEQVFSSQKQLDAHTIMERIEQKIHQHLTLQENAKQAYEVLKEEYNQAQPRSIVISTMIEHLEQYEELQEECKHLREVELEKRKGTAK